MDSEIMVRLTTLEAKVDEMHKYVKRLYNIFLWTGIATVAMFVIPLIGLIFVIPSFLSTYGSMGSYADPTAKTPTDQVNQLDGYAKQLQSLLQ